MVSCLPALFLKVKVLDDLHFRKVEVQLEVEKLCDIDVWLLVFLLVDLQDQHLYEMICCNPCKVRCILREVWVNGFSSKTL